MVKTARTVAKEKYENPVRCPNCGRVLGNISELYGKVMVTYICPRCGDVKVEITG